MFVPPGFVPPLFKAPPSKHFLISSHLQISFSDSASAPRPVGPPVLFWSQNFVEKSRCAHSWPNVPAISDSAPLSGGRCPADRTHHVGQASAHLPSLLNSRGKGPTDETEEQRGWVWSGPRPPVEPRDAALVVVNCAVVIRAITRTTSRTPLLIASDSKDSHRGPY